MRIQELKCKIDENSTNVEKATKWIHASSTEKEMQEYVGDMVKQNAAELLANIRTLRRV